MKHLLDRAYARQRLVSFQQGEARRREDAKADNAWAAFYLILVLGLALSGLLG